jgi:hypothetical protein
MPAVTGDRFSSQTMSDCQFCPAQGRGFRTTRQCAGCARYLCIVCRPNVPQVPFLCPECGGGPREDAIHAPGASLERIQAAGQVAPYWLVLLQERVGVAPAGDVEALLVPE